MLEMSSKSYISGVVEVLPDRGNVDIVHHARASGYIARETL